MLFEIDHDESTVKQGTKMGFLRGLRSSIPAAARFSVPGLSEFSPAHAFPPGIMKDCEKEERVQAKEIAVSA